MLSDVYEFIEIENKRFLISEVFPDKNSKRSKEPQYFAESVAKNFGHLFRNPNGILEAIAKMKISFNKRIQHNFFAFNTTNMEYYFEMENFGDGEADYLKIILRISGDSANVLIFSIKPVIKNDDRIQM